VLVVAAGVLLVTGRSSAGVLVAVAAAAAVSGWAVAGRDAATLAAPLPEGRVIMAARVETDPVERWGDPMVAIEPSHLLVDGGWQAWDGPRLSLDMDDTVVTAGDRILVMGTVIRRPGRVRGDPVAGIVIARRIELLGGPDDPLFATGNLLRARVHDGIEPFRPRSSAALLAGFLIGDVRDLPDADADALRRTGLTHFVAVSGSNVALFLAAWWVAMGPLGWSPRLRAVLGLLGLAVFVVVTRWEPSVVRAATMAGLVLTGRFFGVPVDGWTAFGGAVVALLLVSADLVFDVGFQLSVAATAGVLAGAGIWNSRRPRWAWTALGATASAQIAVAPLLLIHFGTVPLLAPVTNLVAAPLVGLATAAGGIGVMTGIRPVTAVGVAAADLVLGVARAGRDLPQLGWAGVLAVGTAGVAVLHRGLRPLVAVGAAGALAVSVVLPGMPPRGPEMIVLDVGQGDAILLRDPLGATILVDGGPDPAVLRRALTSRRITRIDLLVVTHQHADHTTALVGITGYASVERAWVSPHAEDGGPLGELLEELVSAGTIVEYPGSGWQASVGVFHLEVLGPRRRYASPNDGSIVIRATAAGVTALLAGDIEVISQREIGTARADVLKVPHQGAATSDPDWLAGVGAVVAVISVGPNDYGHPSDEVIAVLEAAGARVLRTDRDGDVVVRFDRVGLTGRAVAPRRYGGGDETSPRRAGPPRWRAGGTPRDAAQGRSAPRPVGCGRNRSHRHSPQGRR
jgi:competence protein ComEC